MSTLPHPDLLPLTGAQRGIYDAQSIDPHSPFYVVGEVLRLRGGIDAPALCAAIEATQREAETLRLRVVAPAEGEDAPRQYVSEEIVPAVVRVSRDSVLKLTQCRSRAAVRRRAGSGRRRRRR